MKATVPCHGRRSMTIAMCPAANLRALISFGGHHSITAAWRFRCSPPLFGAGTVFVCYSIQSGYYRTRCTRPDLSIRRDESAFYDYFLDIYKLIQFWWTEQEGGLILDDKNFSSYRNWVAIDQNFFFFLCFWTWIHLCSYMGIGEREEKCVSVCVYDRLFFFYHNGRTVLGF